MFVQLIQHFGLETEVAQYLAESYGDRAWTVASMAAQTGSRWPLFGRKISPGYPYIEAEVRYCCRQEYACTAVDVLARRTRLAYLNARATLEALPKVIEIMAEELGWTEERKVKEFEDGRIFLLSMGLSIKEHTTFPMDKNLISSSLIPSQITKYQALFNSLDIDKDGRISPSDLRKAMGSLDMNIEGAQLEKAIGEIDVNGKGGIGFNEFLEVLAHVKDIRSQSKFARIVADYEDRMVPIERSNGGV